MTCNCDNDGSNEYIIELNQQGAPGVKGDKGDSGYSPIVTYTTDGNGVQINIVNETTTEQTPVLPTKSYTDTQLAGKLNKDGSNADNGISLRGVRFSNTSTVSVIRSDNDINIVSGSDKDIHLYPQGGGKLYYGATSSSSNEIATIGDIPDISTKLDTDGSNADAQFTINGVQVLSGGIYDNNSSSYFGYNLGLYELGRDSSSYFLRLPGYNLTCGRIDDYNTYVSLNTGINTTMVINRNIPEGKIYYHGTSASNELAIKGDLPTTMVGCDSITGGASGLVPAPSAGDQDKFLKADGTWDTVGGGGSSYTEGRGIDITNDTISVDESVVMTTSNQSTINFGAKQFSRITIANGYNTGEGLYGWLDDGSSTIPLVRVSDLDDVIIGDGGSKLVLHGNETRPSYFDSHTTSYLALYSDIPDTSDMATKTWVGNQGYLTGITSGDVTTALGYTPYNSSNPNGYTSNVGTVTSVNNTSPDSNGNVSLAIPTNSDYVDLTSNQTVGGNKTFTGTNYLRNTYICNAGGTYFGRMRAVDSKFTFEGVGTNRSINFIPDGTGELQYNGTEVATVNDIPDVSQLQEKLTASDGVNIQYNYTPPIVEGLPITLDNDNNIVKVLSYDKAKDDITLTFVVTTSTFTGNFVIGYSDSNAETSVGNGIRMDRYNDGSATQDVSIATMYYGNWGDSLATILASPFNDAGSIYLKLVIHNDSTIDFSYSLDDGITYSTPVSVGGIAGNFHEKYVYMGRGSGQSTVTNVMSNETESVNLISCDNTIQRKLNATGGIKIEPNGSIRVNPLVALPYTASNSSTDKIFNASDMTVDGTTIYGKWGAGDVIVLSSSSTAMESGYGFYWNNNSITAMARLNSQYNGLTTINDISYEDYFYYKIQFFEDGTIDMYYSRDGITYNLAISTTTAVGGALYGQDIYVYGENGSVLSDIHLGIPSTNPVISLDPTTIQGYSSSGTLYLKLVDGVLQWTA